MSRNSKNTLVHRHDLMLCLFVLLGVSNVPYADEVVPIDAFGHTQWKRVALFGSRDA